jgi:hypothetical protein
MSHRLYIGNKMVGIPYFNTPWFDMADRELLKIPTVIQTFNPAEHDRSALGFDPMRCVHGSVEESEAGGFNRRTALRDDWTWIATHSTGMIVGPDWMESTGAKSEVACHHALGLPVWEYDVFLKCWNSPELWSLSSLVSPLTAWPRVSMPLVDDEPDDGGFFCDCHG